MTRTHARSAAGLTALVAVAWMSIALSGPSAVRTGPVDPAQFSAERAMAHVRALAREPRPLGSAANLAARDYLVGALRELGLEPRIQSRIVANRWTLARVENIVARLPGSAGSTGSAILLVAHYDSVPTSPGAGDAAAAVSTILETLRALRAGPPLRNDVIALFSNPEELGLHGALAFVDSDPWFGDVGFVLNMDPGGVSGPALIHETSAGNGWVLAQLDHAVPELYATSMTAAVKKALADRSDEFGVFAEAGKTGADVAFIGSDTHYHSALDRPENLDPRSVQNLGGYALGLARHLGRLERVDQRSADAIYFNPLGSFVVRYPQVWRWPLLLLAAILLLVAVNSCRRRRELTLRGLLAGFAAQTAIAAVAVAASSALWALVARTPRVSGAFLTGDQYQTGLFLLAFFGLTLATTTTGFGLVARRLELRPFLLGGCLVWFLIAIATCLWLPGASYFFVWPLLASLGSVLAAGSLERRRTGSSWARLVLWLGCVPALVLASPTVVTVFCALSTGEGPFLMGLVALVLGLLAPALRDLRASSPRLLPAAGLLLLLVAVVGIFRFRFDAEHPRTTFLVYGLDAETGTAVWATRSRTREELRTDEWNGALFPEAITLAGDLSLFYPFTSRDFLKAAAPVLDLAPPRLELLEDSVVGEHRHLRVRVTSPRGASAAIVVTERPISKWSLDDVAIGHDQIVSFRPVPETGFVLDVETLDLEPLAISVVDTSFGLPDNAVGARPPELMPEPAGGLVFTDATQVRATSTF